MYRREALSALGTTDVPDVVDAMNHASRRLPEVMDQDEDE